MEYTTNIRIVDIKILPFGVSEHRCSRTVDIRRDCGGVDHTGTSCHTARDSVTYQEAIRPRAEAVLPLLLHRPYYFLEVDGQHFYHI